MPRRHAPTRLHDHLGRLDCLRAVGGRAPQLPRRAPGNHARSIHAADHDDQPAGTRAQPPPSGLPPRSWALDDGGAGARQPAVALTHAASGVCRATALPRQTPAAMGDRVSRTPVAGMLLQAAGRPRRDEQRKRRCMRRRRGEGDDRRRGGGGYQQRGGRVHVDEGRRRRHGMNLDLGPPASAPVDDLEHPTHHLLRMGCEVNPHSDGAAGAGGAARGERQDAHRSHLAGRRRRQQREGGERDWQDRRGWCRRGRRPGGMVRRRADGSGGSR